MTDFVLDASAAGALVLDEPDGGLRCILLDRMRSGGRARVPSLWFAEVHNIVLVAERRGRIGRSDADDAVETLLRLPVDVDMAFEDALRASRRFALQHGISSYDALYVELAIRLRLPLATLDRQQATVAKMAGIALIEKSPT